MANPALQPKVLTTMPSITKVDPTVFNNMANNVNNSANLTEMIPGAKKLNGKSEKSDKSFGELFLSNLTFGAINKGNAKIRKEKRAKRKSARNQRKNK